ncbi:MAG: hypothetical protein ACRYG4_23885 [Janthinobacterium lividum]
METIDQSGRAASDADDENALLQAAWPDGIPEAEAAFLNSLTPDRRKLVRRRLGALLQLDANGGVRGAVGKAAASAGLSRIAFYKLRREWTQQRSLSVLAPYSSGPGRSSSTAAEDDRVRFGARGLLGILPQESNGGIAHSIAVALGLKPSARLVGLVQRERRALARDADFLKKAYGRAILIDTCAVSLNLAGEPVVCCLVLEEASLAILGHSVGTSSSQPPVGVAVAAALALLREKCADRNWTGDSAKLRLVLPDEALATVLSWGERIRPTTYQWVVPTGPRRFGVGLVSRVGPRLGKLWLKPQSTTGGGAGPTKAPTRLTPPTLADADVLVAREISVHNAPIFAALAAAGLLGSGRGVPLGSIMMMLARFADLE